MDNRNLLQSIKKKYVPGMRVRLIKMKDSQAPPSGTKGTIFGIDDIGSILIAWDNGSRLSVIVGVDEFEVIS